VAPRPGTPDADDRPPRTSGPRRGRAGSRDRDVRDGGAGPASTALMWRIAGDAKPSLNVDRRALEGLTPRLSRAEGVGLNDWLGLWRGRGAKGDME
jgi:hypothetical protein